MSEHRFAHIVSEVTNNIMDTYILNAQLLTNEKRKQHQENIGRAKQILHSRPENETATVWIQWLVGVVIFLLSRYINED